MDSHNGLLFTRWYGVYRTDERVLTCGIRRPSSRSGAGSSADVASRRIAGVEMIGAFPTLTYEVEHTPVPAGSSGICLVTAFRQMVTKDEQRWALLTFCHAPWNEGLRIA